ncbi:hypothetical protein KR032_004181 [Drosophila birchii]|nr:hypothetical protein KR032_004181 [Drosophila birchii]
MKLIAWVGFSIIMNLPIGQCPILWETTALSVYNRSRDTRVSPGCCSPDWLIQLQQSWCPLLRLLILAVVTLPIYNVVLILVGWRFHWSTRNTAEHLVLHTRFVEHPAPQQPVVTPKPPPRLKRRPALTPTSVSELVPYPSRMNPSTDQDPYQILRRNLQLVLKGLQNPLLEVAPPRVPEPIMRPFEIPSGMPFDLPSGMPSEKPLDVVSLCPSEYPISVAHKKRSKIIFKRLWQRWRSRNKLKKSKKSPVSVSSSSCSSTNGSSCFYVYLEET